MRCISEAETCRTQLEAARLRIEEKHRMERELEVLFASENPPLSIPDYDNVQSVMFELNSILAISQDYSLTFSTVDASQTIIRRSISMPFTADSYQAARETLRQLHDSNFRCMMDNVSISFGSYERNYGDIYGGIYKKNYEGSVSVSATIVFFEYQNKPSGRFRGEGGLRPGPKALEARKGFTRKIKTRRDLHGGRNEKGLGTAYSRRDRGVFSRLPE